MKLQSRIIPPLALAALMHAAPALAADYEPPIFVESGPEYVPVEVGSGWYLRGDVTYNFNGPIYDSAVFGDNVKNHRVGGEIGFGYHFTDYLRADFTTGLVSNDRFSYDDGIDALEAKNYVWSGLANGYIDLGTVAGFTPYVGAGLGVLYSHEKVTLDSGTLGVAGQSSDKQYAFAYALTAGLSYRFTPNTSVDVAYRYLNAPSLEYTDLDSLSDKKGIDYHQIKVGLRYDLW